MRTSSFITVVKRYENLARIGREIVNHKDQIKYVEPALLDLEFAKQEQRIQDFHTEAKRTNKVWNKSKNTIFEFWTGLS